MQPLIIFGAGRIAEVVANTALDANLQIAAFTCETEWIREPTFMGRPLIPFESLERFFSPDQCRIHVAVGYHQLNKARERILGLVRAREYSLASVISPSAITNRSATHGENCFVAGGAVLESGTHLGAGVYVWSNAVIGHHSRIDDHAWIAAGATIGGGSRVGKRCFLALNCTIGNEVTIGEDCLIGAQTLTTRSLPAGSVVVERDTEIHRLTSDQFLRISKLK